ncbi:aquaporin [Neotabrizicola sp. sgz301269]|uniref:aquaporin n=1 Tax=Neotabrizicola sp. sgz301269 TaxID=3276282 RepID=UPI00376FADC5
MPRTFSAELIGTFILVFFGCGAAVIAGADGTSGVGLTGIALAFGLSIVAAAYGLGAISGAHLNPAVSLGVLVAGRMTPAAFVTYVIAQVIGALAAATVLWLIASGSAGWTGGLGTNGYGPGYLGEYSLTSALTFEVVMTFLFVTVILGATGPGASAGFAGLAIGLTLTAIHLVGIKVTGVSVNPARSIGPALLEGGRALSQLWVFILAPLAGGLLAGMVNRIGLTRAD